MNFCLWSDGISEHFVMAAHNANLMKSYEILLVLTKCPVNLAKPKNVRRLNYLETI